MPSALLPKNRNRSIFQNVVFFRKREVDEVQKLTNRMCDVPMICIILSGSMICIRYNEIEENMTIFSIRRILKQVVAIIHTLYGATVIVF